MSANDRFDSLIVQNETLGGMVQFGSGSKLGTIGAAMNHESRISGGLPMFGSEISDNTSGRNLPDIIEREFNGYTTEQIVKEHSISDVTPSRLEEKMNMLNLTAHCNR